MFGSKLSLVQPEWQLHHRP